MYSPPTAFPTSTNAPTAYTEMVQQPTLSPSTISTPMPTRTAHPTMSRYSKVISLLAPFAFNVTVPSSPQEEAARWLADVDQAQISLDSTDSVLQRYIAALLYFSLQGSNWRNVTGWLSSERECTWYGMTCNSEGALTEITHGKKRESRVSSTLHSVPHHTHRQ